MDENTRVCARISCWRSPCPDFIQSRRTAERNVILEDNPKMSTCPVVIGRRSHVTVTYSAPCDCLIVGVFVCLCVLCLSVSSVCQSVCQSVSFILSHFVSLLMFMLVEELKMYFPGLYSSNTFTRLVNIRGLVLSCSPTFTN